MTWKFKMGIFKILIGLVLGVVVYIFMRFDQELDLGYAFIAALLGCFLSFLVYWNSNYLDRRVDWREKTGLRLVAGIIVNLAMVIAVLKALYFHISNLEFIKLTVLIFTIVLLYNIIYFIFYSYNQYAEGQVKQFAFKSKQTTLQFDALRSQLSPHFLFNSLNALSALFHKSLDKSERFIRSLAKSYKYVLDQYENPLIELSQELEFAKAYFEMMSIRFGSQLRLECDLSESDLESQIPPLTIQMLIENAIKHNSVDTDNPLTIRIYSENGYINVENNKLPKPSGRISTNIGLKNISERYKLLNRSSIIVTESKIFRVALPLLNI